MIYDDTLDIKYESETPDGAGGFTTASTTRHSDVPCKFQKRDEISTQRKREIIGDTAEIRYNYLAFIPTGYSFQDDDYITHDSTDYKITGSVTGRLRQIITLRER